MFGKWLLLGLQQVTLLTSSWGWVDGERNIRISQDPFEYCGRHTLSSQSWMPELSLRLELERASSTNAIFGLEIGVSFRAFFGQPSSRRPVSQCRSLALSESTFL